MGYDANLIDEELRMLGKVISILVRPNKFGLRMLHWGLRRNKGADMKDAESGTVEVPRSDGSGVVRVRVFRPKSPQTTPLPILLIFHGGGYAIGIAEQASTLVIAHRLMQTRPCIVISPDYRISLDEPFPAGFNDCYDTLLWAKENADLLGGRSDQIMLTGDSAGGGLTIACCLKARDTGDVNIAFQMPLYPMIDDRQTNPSAVNNEMPVWNSKLNRVGWRLYLRDLLASGAAIPAYAAPSRAESFANLPPAATFIGDLDPFRDETEAYVDSLEAAGIPVQFELFAGAYHGFEQFAADAAVSKRAVQFMKDAFAQAVDNYFAAQT